MRIALLSFVSLLALAGTVFAQDVPLPEPLPKPAPTPLARALADLRDAPRGDRAAAIAKVVDLAGTAADVTRTIRAALPAPPTEAGWHVLEATDSENVTRPYHLYVPESAVRATEPLPLLIDMHGGVSRPEFIDAERFAQFRETWTEIADEYGVVVAMPLGRVDCTWWTDAGVRHVQAVIRDAKRHAPIDSDRVVATGFSDGGSGCYYLAMAAPDPFAALLPMNGHPMVAVGASQRQLYLRNAVSMPLFVCMTQDDGLYPAQTVLPHILALIRESAQIHLVSYPTGGHSPSYFEDQSEAFAGFITSALRDTIPDTIEWATAHIETGRRAWAEVLEIGAADADAPAEAVPDIQVLSSPGRVLIGIGIDREYEGAGVRVTTVDDRRPAGELGLQEGDVVIRVDDATIADLGDLRVVLGKKRFGDELTVEVRRGAESVVATTTIPAFTPEPSYDREREAAWFSLVRDGNTVDVTSRGVRRLRLHLSDAQFDLTNEIVVVVNGIERARELRAPDLQRVVEDWASNADSGSLFPAFIDVAVPAASGETK